MFYIDFRSPEGKHYRIDVAEHPVCFECPVCGEITVYAFEKDDEKYCSYCTEKRQQRENDEKDARLFRQLADYINHERKCHITPKEAKHLLNNPDFRNCLPGEGTHPKITVIHHGRRYASGLS